MKPIVSIFFALLFLVQTTYGQTRMVEAPLLPTATASETEPSKTLFDTWQEEDILSLELEADFTQLIADKNNDEYQSALLTFSPKSDASLLTTVKVKARGKYRRRICDFPPLKLKFTEKVVDGIQMGNYKTLKLVTHCQSDAASKATILREYLTYKMYAALTEQSYRVQLVEITYVDRGESLPKLKRYGFLLEDTDELEDRLNADNCKCGFNSSLNGDAGRNSAARIALFQFMIGNNDWSLQVPKNVKVLERREAEGQISVPYDFDFSAIVDADYAFPNADYGLYDIRDRVLLMQDVDAAALDQAVDLFKSKKTALLDLIQEQDYLSRADRKAMSRYINHFYTLLDQPLDWNHKMVVPFEKAEK